MSRKVKPGQDDNRSNSSDKSILAIPLEWIKNNPMKTAKLVKAYGVPFTGVALAGPMASMLPLGPFSPFAALLATSFASFHLRRNVMDSVCSFFHAGGLSGFQGQVLSLLNFMSLSAAFETLERPLKTLTNELIVSTGGLRASLAGLFIAMVTELTGLFGRTGLNRLGSMLWELMSKGEHTSKGTTQQPLDDWEMVDLEGKRPDDHSDASNERAAELVGEISQLIDECQELRRAERDELIAMLEEEEHNDYKRIGAESDELEDVPLDDLAKADAADDWELLF
ncbi:hypothetical protein CC86DRAFT_403342 [Ophiobolus disseminans]|uniref:Uncharacterized protein n=1 Tax=Ophiobolus disseminans TaxID=1469910 RepID=A0A6A7AAX6_9PLEO|nr:hypothetical protein CC86DRAFT_403342 [Ophiobolus disseminans]